MRRGIMILIIIGLAFVFLDGEFKNRASSSEKVSGPGSLPKPEGKTAGNGPPAQAKETPDKPYPALVEKNIFSPERKEFPLPVSPGSSVKKPPTRPQVVLYGVTIAGDYQSASFIQTGRTLKKGEREMLTLKVGEKIGEYELAKILSDRITLATEEDNFEVLLYDAAKPKTRTAVRTESKPAAVTSALPGPGGPSPVEPPRPVVPGVPTSEIPRPGVSSPISGQERVAFPPMPTPGVPPTVAPSTTPAPQPTGPSTPPVYSPRRRVPITAPPGTFPSDATPPQVVPKESGGP